MEGVNAWVSFRFTTRCVCTRTPNPFHNLLRAATYFLIRMKVHVLGQFIGIRRFMRFHIYDQKV